MGTLSSRTGDVLDAPEGVIAHGCNCRGGFGSGVAGQIARRFPEVRSAYLRKHNHIGWRLGEVQRVDVLGRTFFNVATQDSFGPGGLHADYGAIRRGMDLVLHLCEVSKFPTLAIPRIGAGLAGGDWTRIEAILRDLVATHHVDIVVYSLE